MIGQMAQDKNSFLLYADQLELIEMLPDEVAGKLFKIIMQYVNDLEPEVNDLTLKLAFEPIKRQLKRDLKKYDKKREERSNAGKLGNISRYHPDLYTLYKEGKKTASECIDIAEARKNSHSDAERSQPLAKLADNDNDNVNVNDTVNDNVIDSSIKPPNPLKRGKRFQKPTLEEVKEYCMKRGNSVNPEKWMNHYTANGWKVGKNSMKDWRAAVRTWEGNDTSTKEPLLNSTQWLTKYKTFQNRNEAGQNWHEYKKCHNLA